MKAKELKALAIAGMMVAVVPAGLAASPVRTYESNYYKAGCCYGSRPMGNCPVVEQEHVEIQDLVE